MFETVLRLVWGERLSCDDPVFGHLTTARLKSRFGRPTGDPPLFSWFADPTLFRLPGAQIEEVTIHAGRDGPGEEHRRGWQTLLENYAAFRKVLVHKMYEHYLLHKQTWIDYCREQYGDDDLSRIKCWPQYNTSEQAFDNQSHLWWLDIHGDAYLELYVSNDWDVEHNLRVAVRDGQLVEMWDE